MKKWLSKTKFSSLQIIVIVSLCVTVGSGIAFAKDRTLAEFKKYASEKLQGRLSDAQLDKFAKMVDKDGNGKISDAEFAERLTALQKLGQPDAAPKKNRTKGSDDKTASIPEIADSAKATVLLITAEQLAKSWKPFAEWKTLNGKATKIVTVNRIEKKYKAKSIQEKIRLCVRDHIDHHGTRWVVLGGDCLPNGKGLVPGGHTTVHAQEPDGIPTDIVYLSKTNWDADDDGIYGEFRDDRKAISYPDGSVGLGRIPVRTPADVAAFTEKVIEYESNYPTSEFARQMIYTCTDSPAYPKVRNSWDSYVSKVWKGGEVGRFFSQETPWDKNGKPGSYDLTAENLVKLINDRKAAKLHIHGHGHLPAWVLEKSMFTSNHIAQLKNSGAYPLITTVSCNTGEYDSRNDPSIVERMIRLPKAGSVAVVAPIRTGKPHFANASDFRLMITQGKLDGTTLTMTRYWSNGLGSGLTTGEAIMKAKAQMADDAEKAQGYHLCICELNLLGDPTLDMRAKPPRKPKLEAPKKIGAGKQTVEIVTNAPGSTICLWKGKEIYSVGKADAKGNATFQVNAKTSGHISVSVSGASLNTVTSKILVTGVDTTELSK